MEAKLRRRVEARLGLEATDSVPVEEGWDSTVFELGGLWIVRVPRREEVRASMRTEARLLPALAPALPVPVPRFEVVEDTDVFFVAYRKLAGEPLDPSVCGGPHGAPLAAKLGRFLATLHAFPPAAAVAAGVVAADAAGWLARQQELFERCLRDVVPLLDPEERRRARGLFEAFVSSWDGSLVTVLAHADLGPAHILHRGRSVTAVIDWSDACLGDPALDFAWLLHGTGDAFTAALLDVYPIESTFRERALFYHRLGPWHEALFGLKHHRPALVESGLAGIRDRLPR